MEIRIFKDIIDTIEQLGKGIIALKNLPKKERQHYRDVLSETYSLLDSAVNLVLCRLGDILQIEDRKDFIKELRLLNNFDKWMDIERNVRLCSNLRATGREMQALGDKLLRRISLSKPYDFERLVRQILEGEGSLADFIGFALSDLANMADMASKSSGGYSKAKQAVRKTRDVLSKERKSLISSEIEFYRYI